MIDFYTVYKQAALQAMWKDVAHRESVTPSASEKQLKSWSYTTTMEHLIFSIVPKELCEFIGT